MLAGNLAAETGSTATASAANITSQMALNRDFAAKKFEEFAEF
jgi:hypothetical protein